MIYLNMLFGSINLSLAVFYMINENALLTGLNVFAALLNMAAVVLNWEKLRI